MSKVTITHGKGPVTALVGKGQTVEVELTDDIQAAADAGLIVIVGGLPAKAKKAAKAVKEAVAVHGAMVPEVLGEGAEQEPGGAPDTTGGYQRADPDR